MEYTTALYSIGLITFVLLFVEINFMYATQGFAFGWSSNRSGDAEFSPLAQRISSAYNNQVESAAYSVPVLATAALTGLESSGAELATLIYVIGRAIYGPLYYLGVGNLRLVGFGMGSLSMIYILYALWVSGLIW
ncbi:MAG: MAPEG family protein [Paracoccaceae bacterium]